jgi:uncharacterized membrane protein YraQ (UPF0718 family)
MVAAGYAVELIFGLTGLTPDRADAQMPEAGITWNYTTWLNIAFLILAALLTLRFFRTGGRQMLAMMGGAPTSDTQHGGPPSAA